MKKRLLALALLVVFCMPMLIACSGSPSKDTVEQYARDVLDAVIKQDTAALQSLANPDYKGYFSEKEMAPYYAQYAAWGICDTGNTVGSMKRTDWWTDGEYPTGRGSDAIYMVSIGGIFYELSIGVVKSDAGVGIAHFDLYRLD